jgi:hypothetical protein
MDWKERDNSSRMTGRQEIRNASAGLRDEVLLLAKEMRPDRNSAISWVVYDYRTATSTQTTERGSAEPSRE